MRIFTAVEVAEKQRLSRLYRQTVSIARLRPATGLLTLAAERKASHA